MFPFRTMKAMGLEEGMLYGSTTANIDHKWVWYRQFKP